jgi:predicted protein tyrosine phosphatase
MAEEKTAQQEASHFFVGIDPASGAPLRHAAVISCVLPGRLYIGDEDARHPSVLAAHGIVRVISCQQHWERNAHYPAIRTMPAGVEEFAYFFDDWHTVDITDALRSSYAQIATSPGPCLVHCAAGISRSSSIVAGYLMAAHHLTADAALAYLIERHPRANPRANFRRQLAAYAEALDAPQPTVPGAGDTPADRDVHVTF